MGFVGSFPRICWPARVVSLQLASVLPRKGTCAILAFSSRSHLCLWRLRAFDLLLTWIFRFHWLSSSCTHCNRRTSIMVFEIAFKQKRWLMTSIDYLRDNSAYTLKTFLKKKLLVFLLLWDSYIWLVDVVIRSIDWLWKAYTCQYLFPWPWPQMVNVLHEAIFLNFSLSPLMQLGWGLKGLNKDTTCIGT